MNVDKVLSYAKHARGELAKEALAPEDDAMAPMVVFSREGKTIASVFCQVVNRDAGLAIAHLGIRGWCADEVVCVFDAHVKEHDKDKPITLERGQLQKECEENCGDHSQGVHDALLACWVAKDGVKDFRTIPYHVDYDAGEIEWQDEIHPATAEERDVRSYDGVIPEALKSFFDMKPLGVNLKLDRELSADDDPVTRGLLGLISKTVDPETAKREFLDEAVCALVEQHVPCTVVLTREGVEPV
jgi:hypothetical protein